MRYSGVYMVVGTAVYNWAFAVGFCGMMGNCSSDFRILWNFCAYFICNMYNIQRTCTTVQATIACCFLNNSRRKYNILHKFYNNGAKYIRHITPSWGRCVI
ncbi:hypothetical protein BYT27DRAFT_6335686 [Phlegmacium glaucopus]|nr:hypothetical protein BYT27DRAFT_6335686 [Phlegmacium glaucopus]